MRINKLKVNPDKTEVLLIDKHTSKLMFAKFHVSHQIYKRLFPHGVFVSFLKLILIRDLFIFALSNGVVSHCFVDRRILALFSISFNTTSAPICLAYWISKSFILGVHFDETNFLVPPSLLTLILYPRIHGFCWDMLAIFQGLCGLQKCHSFSSSHFSWIQIKTSPRSLAKKYCSFSFPLPSPQLQMASCRITSCLSFFSPPWLQTLVAELPSPCSLSSPMVTHPEFKGKPQ